MTRYKELLTFVPLFKVFSVEENRRVCLKFSHENILSRLRASSRNKSSKLESQKLLTISLINYIDQNC